LQEEQKLALKKSHKSKPPSLFVIWIKNSVDIYCLISTQTGQLTVGRNLTSNSTSTSEEEEENCPSRGGLEYLHHRVVRGNKKGTQCPGV
jgi:hypothetical protein